MPSNQPKIGRTFVSYSILLAVSVGGYIAYLNFVDPLIIPDLNIGRPPPTDYSEYEKVGEEVEHHSFFVDDAWERQPCSVLRTSSGKILFQDYEMVDATTWLVFPFTMILEQANENETGNESTPVLLRCVGGARLFFDKPVSSLDGSKIGLRSAQLEGDVDISKPEHLRQIDDEFWIKTSNIKIQDRMISTIDDVAFRFGKNVGMGRNLTLWLSHSSETNRLSPDFSKIDGIEKIRLGILSNLRLMSSETESDSQVHSVEKTPLEISAHGPFEFNFADDQANFWDRVEVKKLDGSGDRLSCQQLQLNFDRKNKTSRLQFNSNRGRDFQLRMLTAFGTPARLTAKSENASVVGEKIEYDLLKKIVRVADPNSTMIFKDDFEFTSKNATYQFGNDRRLGLLNAAGPGRLIRNSTQQPFRLFWNRNLSIRPTADHQHVVSVDGQPRVRVGETDSINANQIRLVVSETRDRNHIGSSPKWQYQPVRLAAQQDVHVSTVDFIADTDRLVAVWETAPNTAFELGQSKKSRFNEIRPHKTAEFHRQDLLANNLVRRVSFDRVVLERNEKKQPILARSEVIEVQLKQKIGSENIGVGEVLFLNDVAVRQFADNQGEQSRFEIFGGRLQLTPTNDEQYQIQIYGGTNQLAKFVSANLMLQGPEISMDQNNNSVWINGAGQLKMNPHDSSQYVSTRKTFGDSLQVEFDGGMIFDGRQVYFEEGVDAAIFQAAPSIAKSDSMTRAKATALKIVLDRQVNLTQEPDGLISKPKIIQTIFRDRVSAAERRFSQLNSEVVKPVEILHRKMMVDNKTAVDEQLVLLTSDARIDHVGNRLNARGPGKIQLHKRGQNQNKAAGFGFVGAKRRATGEKKLTYINAQYNDRLVANLSDNQLQISGAIRSLYCPVESTAESFSIDQVNNLPVGSVHLNCQRIDLIQSESPLSPRPQSQFIATGQAHIYSDTFESIADRISYTDDTNLLLAEGFSNRDVSLTFRSNPQASAQNIKGKRLIYDLEKQIGIAENVGGISAPIDDR